jgi:hypothetical protein
VWARWSTLVLAGNANFGCRNAPSNDQLALSSEDPSTSDAPSVAAEDRLNGAPIPRELPWLLDTRIEARTAVTPKRRSTPIDAGRIDFTIDLNRPRTSRICWPEAVASRDRDAPPTARITVELAIAASGRVKVTKTSGEPSGYHGLLKCISAHLETWVFPLAAEPDSVFVNLKYPDPS